MNCNQTVIEPFFFVLSTIITEDVYLVMQTADYASLTRKWLPFKFVYKMGCDKRTEHIAPNVLSPKNIRVGRGDPIISCCLGFDHNRSNWVLVIGGDVCA